MRALLASAAALTMVVAPTASDAAAEPDPAGKRKPAKIVVRDSRFGPVIWNPVNDLVLYLFTKETGKKSRCYGPCAKAWPPYKVKREPQAGNGADPALIGTTERRNGDLQATYGGHPLYYYEHDGPGTIFCHDVFEFGGDWLVVAPDGDAAPSL